MADKGARYDTGAPIFMVRVEMKGDKHYLEFNGFFSRIFPNLQGLKARLRAGRIYMSKEEKVYVCLNPEWVEIDEKDLDAWKDYDETRIQAEIERIRALHGAVPTEQTGEPKA